MTHTTADAGRTASVAYDPELDLWALLDAEGYTVGHECTEAEARAALAAAKGAK